MRVFILSPRVHEGGRTETFGDIVEVEDADEARRMIAAGIARPVRSQEIETAVVGAAPERAVTREARAKAR